MASQPRREEPHPDRDGVRPGPQGAVRGGHQHVADVPRSRAPRRRGHHRRDRRRRALGVHLRRCRQPPEFHDRAVVGVQSAAGYDEGRPLGTSWMTDGGPVGDGQAVGTARPLVIAIDGPAGAGKSTVGAGARQAARARVPRHGGDVPRVTFAALRAASTRPTVPTWRRLAPTVRIDVGDDTVLVDGVDATAEIRSREVTEAVSAVAANPRRARRAACTSAGVGATRVAAGCRGPRHRLGRVPRRRAQAVPHRIAAGARRAPGGRDRRRRRRDRGGDHRPRPQRLDPRPTARCAEADGAVVVDTTGMTIDEVVEHILEMLPDE